MTASALVLRKALETDSTASSFTALIPTVTEPSGAGVFRLSDIQYGAGCDGHGPKFLQLIPFGGNANNDEFSMRVIGWSKTGLSSAPVYVPQLLLELAVVLGNISGSAIAANTFMADTLTVTYGPTDGASVISPANDLSANAILHIRGCEYIQFDFDMTTGGDHANCFWRAMDQN